MKRNVITKKGFTLVEVLISMTILIIIIVPVSSLVLNSTRINKDGEDKQTATVLAQEYMEKAKTAVIEDDPVTGHLSSATLVPGYSISESDSTQIDDTEVSLTGLPTDTISKAYTRKYIKKDKSNTKNDSYITEEYTITTTIKQNGAYKFKEEPDSDSTEEIPASAFPIEINGSTIKVDGINENAMSLTDFRFTVTNSDTKLIYKGIDTRTVGSNGNIRVDLKSDIMAGSVHQPTTFKIDAYNKTGGELKIYIVKHKDVVSDCQVTNKEGKVTPIKNIIKLDSTEYKHTTRVYDVEIEVKKGSKVLQKISGKRTVEE